MLDEDRNYGRSSVLLSLAVLRSWIERISGADGLAALASLTDDERARATPQAVNGSRGGIRYAGRLARAILHAHFRASLATINRHNPAGRRVRYYLSPHYRRSIYQRSSRSPTPTPDPEMTRTLQGHLQRDAATISTDLPVEAQIGCCLPCSAIHRACHHPWRLYRSTISHGHAAVAGALTERDAPLFLLGGDVSGIQSFIYTLTAAGATKSLRGRSFYLQLLTEGCYALSVACRRIVVCQSLIRRRRALLPGAPEHDRWRTCDRLARHTAGGVRSFLFTVPPSQALSGTWWGTSLSQHSLLDAGAFRQTWGATEAINTAKRRRFSALGTTLVEVFAPQGHGGNERCVCRVWLSG